MPFEPKYLQLHRSGELTNRAEQARESLYACDLCPRLCMVDRSETMGGCRTGLQARVASFSPHHGEEDPLRGQRGSGTIFFSWCNLRCQYCQNADISQAPAGREVSPEDLAGIMLSLQRAGCHNINFVSPSHVVPSILDALVVAVEHGLHLPLVYNTGGYDALKTLTLLEDVIDIYMPDMKYADPDIARRYSKIPNYPKHNQAAVREMHRQVGDLVLDDCGIAQRGLLVRHLILPGGMAGTEKILHFLKEEISSDTYLNLMDQYRPTYKIRGHPELGRPITHQEHQEAVQMAREIGLTRLDQWRAWF